MNEETQNPILNIVEEPIRGLALAINKTYTYAQNSYFGAMIPNYYRDYYYRNIQLACGWLDGFVWSVHSQSGIISTRIGSELIAGLTKQIVGEQLVFKKASSEKDYSALRFVANWSKDNNLLKAVYSGIGYALAIGTSVIKVNKRADGSLWCEAVRLDNCFYMADYSNEIQEATFFMRGYTDTRPNAETQQFVLCEKRWYEYEQVGKIAQDDNGDFVVQKRKGERTAMVQYNVYQTKGTTYNNLMVTDYGAQSIKWEQLPQTIRKAIKKDYGALRVGEPQKLGFPTIGAYLLTNGESDLSVPTGTNFGRGMLIGIQDDLITYEIASSYLIRDMYLGKGTVYVPKDLNISDLSGVFPTSSPLTGLGETKIETIKGVPADQQKIVVEQFNLRSQEWQLIKENSLKNIAVKWGMSPKILASFLATGAVQQTATQIDSEDDMSIAFISHTRAYFKKALNDLIELVLNYHGKDGNVEIDFASPSLVNKDRILDRTIKELENGLIDIEEALRILNPDMDEEALQAKISVAKQARNQMFLDKQTEMNEEGSFDNLYDDLGGANLKGSTEPLQ